MTNLMIIQAIMNIDITIITWHNLLSSSSLITIFATISEIIDAITAEKNPEILFSEFSTFSSRLLNWFYKELFLHI
jgi:hypothetical protein